MYVVQTVNRRACNMSPSFILYFYARRTPSSGVAAERKKKLTIPNIIY